MARPKRLDDQLPDDRPPPHVVETLVGLGFRKEDVERRSATWARAMIEKHKRDTTNAVSRADGVAVRNDGTTFPPPQPERDAAAAWLAGAMAKSDRYELLLALDNAVHHLADDEVIRLSGHMLQRLKTVPTLPDTGRSLLQASAEHKPAEDAVGSNDGEQGIEI